jgi:integrase
MAAQKQYPELREVIFASGERFAFLLDDRGIPLDEPMLFSAVRLRHQHKAYKTLVNYLHAVRFLYLWASSTGIDLKQAIQTGTTLKFHHIESFAAAASMPLSQLAQQASLQSAPPKLTRMQALQLESVRPKLAKPQRGVSAQHQMIRMFVARDFLKWWMDQEIAVRIHDPVRLESYRVWADTLIAELTSLIPTAHRSHLRGVLREGLGDEAKAALLSAIKPGSETNPFASPKTQQRNELIVIMLLQLGMRPAELLNLKTSDLNLQSATLLVLRRPDDPDDKRKVEPNVKTRARQLELPGPLCDMLLTYVTKIRGRLFKARKHDFLIVSDEGDPLSLAALALIFRTLRTRVAGLPSNLSGHMLRHTWNDDFSAMMDRQTVSPERESQLRSYYMGWNPNSGTAVSYTKRYTRRKAGEYSLKLQEDLSKKKDK